MYEKGHNDQWTTWLSYTRNIVLLQFKHNTCIYSTSIWFSIQMYTMKSPFWNSLYVI